jgi:hypothetical protein
MCRNTCSDVSPSIVAVHGLNGHRDKTWTAPNGVHWLRDLLTNDIPNARILCWGYDANTYGNSRVSCQYLYDHAISLVSDLCLERRLTNVGYMPEVTSGQRVVISGRQRGTLLSLWHIAWVELSSKVLASLSAPVYAADRLRLSSTQMQLDRER